MKSYYDSFASLSLALVSLALGSGCATLHSVSVTNIPQERGRPVQASADSFGIFGIFFSNDFADQLPEELRGQCPKGNVTGIYSKYQSTSYLVVLTREVTVHGYCVAGQPAVAPPPSGRRVPPRPVGEQVAPKGTSPAPSPATAAETPSSSPESRP